MVKYYAINLKLTERDPRTHKPTGRYETMLFVDEVGDATEIDVKNKARALYGDAKFKIVFIKELTHDEFLVKSGMGEKHDKT